MGFLFSDDFFRQSSVGGDFDGGILVNCWRRFFQDEHLE